mgnify:FL=1
MGSGAFLASSGLRWNLRCACRSRILPAIRWQTFQSLSSHHASFISAIGIVRYPQRLSRVGVLVQWMQIAASLGNSSVPSGGQMAIFTSSLAVSTRGIIVRSPIFHRPSLSFSHAYARTMQSCPKTRTSKASPSPSLESMPILTGIRPLSSDSDGTMPGKSLTMLVCIHDASGSCRHVLTRAANETSSEIAAIITDGVNHCPIDSSFLRLFFLGLVCAISSLRRGKEPFSTVRPMEVLQMIAYVVRCDTCGAEAFVPLNQDPDMAMSARGWRMRPHSKMCKDCVFAVEGPKIPPSMAEV